MPEPPPGDYAESPLPPGLKRKKGTRSARRRKRFASKRLLAWLSLVILILACANLAILWAFLATGERDGIAGAATPSIPPRFALPEPELLSAPTPTATRVVIYLPTATDTPTAAPTPIPKATLPPATPGLPPEDTPGPPPSPGEIKYVVIISIDGLRPDALELAHTPTLDSLIAKGAYSPRAQTLSISRTLPSHASMLGGMVPEKHGIVWGEPYIGWPGMNGPTIFSVAHHAGLSTAMVFGKEKFRYLILPNSVDRVFGGDDIGDEEVKNRAVEFIQAGLPHILFIHFPDTDRVGHSFGWMSEQQLQAVAFADSMMGEVIAALEQGGYLSNTLLIVSADHGGHGRNHGDDSPEDRTIPWLAVGPGIPAGIILNSSIQTYDTAATVLHALKLPIPETWDGHPVTEIFEYVAG